MLGRDHISYTLKMIFFFEYEILLIRQPEIIVIITKERFTIIVKFVIHITNYSKFINMISLKGFMKM